jgi:hypothetical protein
VEEYGEVIWTGRESGGVVAWICAYGAFAGFRYGCVRAVIDRV